MDSTKTKPAVDKGLWVPQDPPTDTKTREKAQRVEEYMPDNVLARIMTMPDTSAATSKAFQDHRIKTFCEEVDMLVHKIQGVDAAVKDSGHGK